MKDMKFDSNNLVDKYSDMIYRIAIEYLRNKDDAEDMVQDVFVKYIKFIKSGETFLNESHEKYWLIGVTANLCRNEYKKAKNKRNVVLTENYFTDMKFTEDEIHLLECISKLSEKYRDAFELFYIKDLSIHEISKILNISEDAVKTRLKRARDKIRKIF